MKSGSINSTDTTAQVKHRLASLRHLDLRQHSIEDLTVRVRELLEGQPLRCLEFAPGLLLYRGIPCEQLPERLADVSYPPAELVRHDQRANRAGVPMFYCSATWHPPFFEAGVQPGDGIVISRWQTQAPLRILSFGYADTCADDPNSDRETALRRALANLPTPTREVAEFLTNTFTKTVHDDNQHHYRLSIAVAEACQLGQAFDGLLYPSAAMPSPAHNQLPRQWQTGATLRRAPARKPRDDRNHRCALARHRARHRCRRPLAVAGPARQLGAAREKHRHRLPAGRWGMALLRHLRRGYVGAELHVKND
jgi:hypothetical protein